VGNYDIEAVSRAALEDDHETFVGRACPDRGECRARQETWDGGGPDNRECPVAKEYSARDGHKTAPNFLQNALRTKQRTAGAKA
jgi:hypothetical protein